ncbi:MAG: hypothetical protein RL348_1084 [Bacteroidota bacterium]
MIDRSTYNQLYLFRNYVLFGLLLYCICSMFSCANPLPPGGGPKDTVPPEIINSSLKNGSLQVSVQSIQLEFSEYIDRNKVAAGLFITPSIPFETHWSGKELDIQFEKPFEKNTTYALTVGTDFTDYAGNKPVNAFTLLFSTGSVLDSGKISGQLFGQLAQDCYVFLYAADSANPTTTQPTYKTQIGSNGQFTISALPYGKYKMFAIKDEWKNNLYDIGIDAFGIPSSQVECFKDSILQYLINIRAPKDTVTPLIYSVRNTSKGIIEVQCSEELDSLSIHKDFFLLYAKSVQKTVSKDSSTIKPTAAYRNPVSAQSILIEYDTNVIATSIIFQMQKDSLLPKDRFGNKLTDSSGFRECAINPKAEVKTPSIINISLKDSIIGFPLLGSIECISSASIDPDNFARATLLSQGNKTIPVEITNNTGTAISIKPSSALENDTWYSLSISSTSLKDSKGTPFKDTVLRYRFKTQDSRLLGSIQGILQDQAGTGPYIISLRKADKTIAASISIEKKGPFQFTAIPSGNYTIEAFEDKDQSGTYTYGDILPYVFAERFIIGAKTGSVSVKQRWSVDGIIIELPLP